MESVNVKCDPEDQGHLLVPQDLANLVEQRILITLFCLVSLPAKIPIYNGKAPAVWSGRT